jgi:hypothetical protein
MKMKAILLSISILLAGIQLHAQVLPRLGAERAGISALTFLKLEASPRSEALAGAAISGVGDGYAISWNPAAMTDLQYNTYALSTRVMAADITNSFASGIFKFKNASALGISAEALNSGPIEKTTVFQPDGTGQYVYAMNTALGLSYGKVLSDFFSIGVTAKYVREQLAEFSANTVAVDLGFLYKTDFKDLRFAAVIQNFGPNSSLGGNMPTNQFFPNTHNKISNYSPASTFKIGASMVPYKTDMNRLTMNVQLNHPNDNGENISMGAEYMYSKVLFLRAGYYLGVKDQSYPTFGAGIKTHIGRHPLMMDYAAVPNRFLGFMQTIGATISINRSKNVQQ